MSETDHTKPVGRDVYEAAVAFLAAPAEEAGLARQTLELRVAEARATPGESEGAARWRLTRAMFDDVARTAEADGAFRREPFPFARFDDLDDQTQARLVSALGGVFAQCAQVSRHKGSQR